MSLDYSRVLPYFAPVQSADETAPLRAFGSKDGPVSRPFSATLNVQYLFDEPGALVFVRERDVDPEHRDTLHAHAVANLRRHAAARKLRFQPEASMCIAKLDGQHDAALLLLDELWDPPTRIIDPDGELIVAIPSRSTLAFAGSATGTGDLRATLGARDGVLCPELFVRRGGMWVAFC